MNQQTKAPIAVFCRHDKMIDPAALVSNPRNPNKHPESQIEVLARVIKSQGWRSPIVVSKRSGFIVKGHGRLAAAMLLEAQSVPVEFQEYETELADSLYLTTMPMEHSDLLKLGLYKYHEWMQKNPHFTHVLNVRSAEQIE